MVVSVQERGWGILSEEGVRMAPLKSFGWGVATFLLSNLLGTLVGTWMSIPFMNILIAGIFWYGYLRPKKIHFMYFVLGYFAIAIIAAVILGVAILWLLTNMGAAS